MFLDEVAVLTKQGLKAAYMPVEANERFYKGKLLASQNIKCNLMCFRNFAATKLSNTFSIGNKSASATSFPENAVKLFPRRKTRHHEIALS